MRHTDLAIVGGHHRPAHVDRPFLPRGGEKAERPVRSQRPMHRSKMLFDKPRQHPTFLALRAGGGAAHSINSYREPNLTS